MSAIDIHYMDMVFRPFEAGVNVIAMTKAARTVLVTTRHEMPVRAMPTSACGRCRSCLL